MGDALPTGRLSACKRCLPMARGTCSRRVAHGKMVGGAHPTPIYCKRFRIDGNRVEDDAARSRRGRAKAQRGRGLAVVGYWLSAIGYRLSAIREEGAVQGRGWGEGPRGLGGRALGTEDSRKRRVFENWRKGVAEVARLSRVSNRSASQCFVRARSVAELAGAGGGQTSLYMLR